MDRKQRFIEKAIKKHGNKYDYSKVDYRNCKEKVCIICPKHGEFWQTPDNHLQNNGCLLCGFEQKWETRGRLGTDDFIEKARKTHGDKYDYSKVEYNGAKDKVCIICPKHGEFWQAPSSHIQGNGCPKCKSERLCETQTLKSDCVLERFKEVHGNKFDYSECVYKGMHVKVKIKCKVCGEFFWQEPNCHMRGRGCPHCVNKTLTTEKIKELFKKTHGDKYDYSKVVYKTMKTKVCIICPKHGEFWQSPDKHLRFMQGCPSCKESHLEGEIRTLLETNSISFEYDKGKKWLGGQRLDFFLPQYNVAIECQGIQHFKPSAFSSKVDAKENFKKLRSFDKMKLEKCRENNVDILYYTDLNYTTFLGERVFNDKEKIIKYIIEKETLTK